MKNKELQSTITLSQRKISTEEGQEANATWHLPHPQTHHSTHLGIYLQNNMLSMVTRDVHDNAKNVFPLSTNFLQNRDEHVGELFFSRCYSPQREKTVPCVVSFTEKRAHAQKSKDEELKNKQAHEAVATCWDLETGAALRTLRAPLGETDSFDTLGACSASGRVALCAHSKGYQTATHRTDLQHFVQHDNIPGYFNSHIMLSPSGDWTLYCSQIAPTKEDEEAGNFTVLPYTLCYFGAERFKHMAHETPESNMRAYMLQLAALQDLPPLMPPQKMQEALGMGSLKQKMIQWWENKNTSSQK